MHQVQGVDILCSESKRFGVSRCTDIDASKVTTSVNISATEVKLSKERIKIITKVIDALQGARSDVTINGETTHASGMNHPRINDQVGLCLQKLRISCPLIDIVLVDDKQYKPNRKILFEAILVDLLNHEAMFGNDDEIYETRVASQNIATNRLQGLGIEYKRAKEIIDTSIIEFNGLQNSDIISQDNARWQVAMSQLICKIYNDSLAHIDEGDLYLILCSLGVRFYLEELVYDWRVSISISPLHLRNANGVCLLQIMKSSEMTNEESQLQNDESAMSINVMKNEAGCVYGEGGLPLSIYADDLQLESSVANTTYENHAFFSIGLCECLCLDEEILKVINVISDIFTDESKNHIEDKSTTSKALLTATTICGEISKLNVLFCTNKYKPFMEITLGLVTIDILSNPELYEEGKAFLITADSKITNIVDLSYEGKIYDQVMIDKDIDSKNDPNPCQSFGLKLALPSDARKFPSELLITFDSMRLVILRRFVNDLLQYLLTPDYGVGRILQGIYGNDENTEPEHPLWFQIHFNDCSILLPKHSDSSEMVALTSSKVVLANGFEESSWSYPAVYLDDQGKDANTGEEFGANNELLHCNPLCDMLPDDEPFDTSLIFRVNVTATDINIFTGISAHGLEKESKNSRNLREMKSFLDFSEVIADGKVFTVCGDTTGCPILGEFCERVWEKVTTTPLSLEVVSDFLPSSLRVLIKDSNLSNGLGLDLRMSQFYAILSVWYDNMQELPVLFPYSANMIDKNVTIPTIDSDWPEYGTRSFVGRLVNTGEITFEIAVCFNEIKWHCKLDDPQFFQKRLNSSSFMDSDKDDLILLIKNLIVQVDFDIDGVMRTGIGATLFSVKDKRSSQTCFERAFEVNPFKTYTDKARSINMTWGLDCGRVISSDDLDFPFQVSIVMTPDRWCLINLGIEELDTCTVDLAPIWILLEYFSSYYVDGDFGNPYFTEKERSDEILGQIFDVKPKDEECLNIDFRLWLLRPCVRIISNPSDLATPAFVLKSAENGLFYRYKTIGLDLASQEIYTNNLDVMRLKRSDMTDMNLRLVYTSGNWITMLVRSLHLDVVYDHNIKSNHTDIHVNLAQSFESKKDNEGIEFPHKKVVPIQIPLPKICKPSLTPSHELGPISCEIDFMSPEHFKMAFQSLYKFAGPSMEKDSNTDKSTKDPSISGSDSTNDASFSIFVDISGLKVFISDPLLGVHMPILVVNIPNLHINCSQLRQIGHLKTGISNASDLQACIDAHLWVDYYKSGPTRSWEPLMEPYQCRVLFEKSTKRGQGIIINSECPLHINFSGAFLETLAFAAQSFAPFFYRLGIKGEKKIDKKSSMKQQNKSGNVDGISSDAVTSKVIVKELHDRVEINHEWIPMMNQSESAVFSLTNLTGDQIRYHQQLSHKSAKLINYLQHKGSVSLDFPATRSLVMNLKIVEIPVFKNGEQIYNDTSSGRLDSSNYIDLQIPGFNWSRSIPVDITGKRFVGLQPKSSALQVSCSTYYILYYEKAVQQFSSSLKSI